MQPKKTTKVALKHGIGGYLAYCASKLRISGKKYTGIYVTLWRLYSSQTLCPHPSITRREIKQEINLVNINNINRTMIIKEMRIKIYNLISTFLRSSLKQLHMYHHYRPKDVGTGSWSNPTTFSEITHLPNVKLRIKG